MKVAGFFVTTVKEVSELCNAVKWSGRVALEDLSARSICKWLDDTVALVQITPVYKSTGSQSDAY